MDTARGQSGGVFTSWEQMAAQLSPYVPAAAVAPSASGTRNSPSAATPVAVERLISQWSGDITSARNAALLSQLNAEVAGLSAG